MDLASKQIILLSEHRVAVKSFLGALSNLRKATNSFVMSVRLSAWNGTAVTGRILTKSGI